MNNFHRTNYENGQDSSKHLNREIGTRKISSHLMQQLSKNRWIIAHPDMSVEQVKALISPPTGDFSRYVLVMQENQLTGIFTYADLTKLADSGTDLTTIKLGDAAQWPTNILSEQRIKQFFHTLSIFKQYWQRSLPVVNEQGQVVDIVTPEMVRRMVHASLAGYSQPLQNPTGEVVNHSYSEHSYSEHSYSEHSDLNHGELNHSDLDPLDHRNLDYRDQELQQCLAQKTAEYGYVNRQLGLATDLQKQLESQLAWHHESERILGGITGFLQKNVDLKVLFRHVVSQIKDLLQADRVCIYRFHADWSALAIAEAVTPDYPSLLGFLIRNELVSDEEWLQKYQSGQPCIVTDMVNARQGQISTVANTQTATVGDSTDTLLKFFQVKATLAIPIHRGQELWGLVVVHQCAMPRQWQESEISLLQRLGMQLGLGVEQLQLRQDVQQLQDDLYIQRQAEETRLRQTLEFEGMLQRITDRVRDSLDEDQILQTAVQELTMVLGAASCQAIVCALGDNFSNCSIRHEYVTPAYNSNLENQKFAFPELCEQVQQGHHSQFCWTQPFLNSGKEAILVCPIFDDQGYLGCLRVFASRSHIFNEEEIRVVQQVASHCAIAIRQARLYQAAQTQVRELERLNQLKDDFLSTVSHELRTPLASIKMVTNLLKLSLKQAEPDLTTPGQTETQSDAPHPTDLPTVSKQNAKIAQYLKTLEEECDREIGLVNDLLAAQQLNAGIHPLSLTTIHLQNWIPHIAETFQHRIHTNQQTLEIDIPDDLSPLISDSFMLSRIIVELLINACKYTPAGGGIQVSAHSLPESKDDFVLVQVKNSGVEISPNELPRIFDPFYRIPNNNPWKHGGTGLGLSLTQKLVEYLGGTIVADSSSKQVCFTIKLPIEAPV